MSEFGTGYAYNLGLFLAHAERIQLDKEMYRKLNINPVSMWFNAAADHLYDLVVPHSLPPAKKAEISQWQVKCLQWRHDDSVTIDDFGKAINYAKQLLLDWDLACGIAAEKAEWS